jgi:hypothetical protein
MMKLQHALLASRAARNVAVLFALAYLTTWAFGVPAVVSYNDRSVVEEFKRVVARGERDDIRPSHPVFYTLAAVPAFPGIVVSLRAYSIAGRYGWGGLQTDVWWPGGVRPWFKITMFVS